MHISDPSHTINQRIHRLYPPEVASRTVDSVIDLVFKYKQRIKSSYYRLSEDDVILITYGDQVTRSHEPSLYTLREFLDTNLKGILNSVHILPFYPSSSDGGFSIVNYNAVDPQMGSWREIEAIGGSYRLMVDAVINHASQFSDWFTAFLSGDEYFKDFFIDVDPATDLSAVVRPRTSPLLSEFIDDSGRIHHIWTTFSRDQVDLNYKNHRVLRNVLDSLFYYIEKGATLIRLDAIAFVWKEIGTECVHLHQTHELIQLMREVLHEVAPEVIIITETNVPHEENISYFGSGDDEAQMVYNFALPPLLVHSVQTGDTSTLVKWAQTLTLPSDKVCFFNFTASHDGIGLRPVKGILTDTEVENVVQRVIDHGGLVSYRTESDGSETPYELNCSYIDALSHPKEDDNVRIKRMLLAQATALIMPGVPGIYFHSLVGARNYHDGVKHTGVNRDINREKFHVEWLQNQINSEATLPNRIFGSYKQLISIRKNEKSFNPFGDFKFFDFHPSLFVVKRSAPDSSGYVLVVHNFTDTDIMVDLPDELVNDYRELLTNDTIDAGMTLTLQPYQMMWLKA